MALFSLPIHIFLILRTVIHDIHIIINYDLWSNHLKLWGLSLKWVPNIAGWFMSWKIPIYPLVN